MEGVESIWCFVNMHYSIPKNNFQEQSPTNGPYIKGNAQIKYGIGYSGGGKNHLSPVDVETMIVAKIKTTVCPQMVSQYVLVDPLSKNLSLILYCGRMQAWNSASIFMTVASSSMGMLTTVFCTVDMHSPMMPPCNWLLNNFLLLKKGGISSYTHGGKHVC